MDEEKDHDRGGRGTTPREKRRPGGRPRLLEDRVTVTVYLPGDLAEAADRLRGTEPWSSWIRRLVEKAVTPQR